MTHLGVQINQIVNLVTMQLPKDNRPYPFYYDRQPNALFSIPAGFSFVITDIIINPEVTSFSSGQFYLVVITIAGSRSFTVRCDGQTGHYPLTGGLVIPDPTGHPMPAEGCVTARNTTFSTGPIEVQLLGYFVRESLALGTGQPFSF